MIWYPWWRYQMETFSALLAICAGSSPVTDEFPSQKPVTWSFDVFFDLRLNKRLSKQPWGWLFDTPSHPLWRHCNVIWYSVFYCYQAFSYRSCAVCYNDVTWHIGTMTVCLVAGRHRRKYQSYPLLALCEENPTITGHELGKRFDVVRQSSSWTAELL